ncbi:flagellar hook-length control protein FliK [Cupriavidus agavae]|uniref:Flagellar hook-length control protein FliK n=1 Tax=Cupriavidus agavae TaxID=1001822 RepID=A0A4Q7RDZ8_9BURK|nr:flagellar hook-length control protein FliK [Cupriavidus agavae]RZT30817.1 flagellar hook-length control protein FliK [Cupriavidus agavae]
MIDISQIAGNAAAALSNLKSPDPARGNDANLFQETLSRARQDNQAATTAVKVPAKDGKQAEAGKNGKGGHDAAAQKPADKAQASPNNALPKQDTGKVAKSDGSAKDAGAQDTSDAKDDATASADAAAVAAALAAAALLAPLPTPQPANQAAGAADATALAGLPALPGQPAPAVATAAPLVATPAAAADAAADAAALQAQADANKPAGIVTEAPKGSVPNVADTLALIAQQRAALQNNTPTAADKLAAAATAATPPATQNAGGQGAGQQQANLGQSGQPALPQGDVQATQTAPSATPFAAAQASVRTGEAADTGATNASSAATMASALAAQSATQHASASAATAAARAAIAPHMADSQWSQALGQQMVRLSTQGAQTAELDLNPPNLGPLKVVLNVVNDQAQAQFVSPHQAVRAAVEAALPQLRTSMAEAGIQLGHTSVGADSFAQAGNNGQQQQQPQRQSGNGFGQAMGFGSEPAAPAPATPRAPRVLARGEVDTFA